MTTCPKCNYPMHCGCSPWCLTKIPAGTKPYTWTADGEAIACPNCGFTASEDFWFDQDIKELKKVKK